MKPISKTSRAILMILLGTVIIITVSSWALAQSGEITRSAKELTEEMRIRSAPSRILVDTLTNEAGNDNLSALEMSDLSYWDLNRMKNVPISQNVDLNYKPDAQSRVLSWETGAGKSYLIPALEIPGFVLALNGFSRLVLGNQRENGKKVYSTNLSTFWDHVVHGPWGFDQDAFSTNQFLHPYQGTIYHGFARSAGLNFWESLGYTFVGSFLWETAGETTSPSINDQVASGIAGSLLGEPLFRMANLLLQGGSGKPGFWRELGAAVISPPTGFNRLVFGDRFRSIFPSHDPAIFHSLWFGAGLLTHVGGGDSSSAPDVHQITSDYTMSYGLPGKPGYNYRRPFDYFQLEFSAVSRIKNPLESITTRGLLFGKKYEAGDAYRGIWGVYGSYDYISPHTFRVSSTAASLGTTSQWWLAPAVALQGTALLGIGYAAAGLIHGEGERDYHYGVAGQGLLELRLIFDNIAMLNATGREYYVSGFGSTEPRGREIISRLDAGLTIRIYGRHAIGVQYVTSRRDAHYPDRTDKRQTPGTFSLVYTQLGHTRFGAVEWRTANSQ